MININKTEFILRTNSFLNSLVFFAPVAILVRTQYGISVSEFFILQAILSISIFLFEVPCGFITDKIGYKNSLILSQILLCITRIIFLIGGGFIVFLIEAIVEALSMCFVSGTFEAYVYENSNVDEFEEKQAIIGNYGTIGFILSTILFIPLNEFFGINGLVFATLISLLVSLGFLIFLPKENINKNDKITQDEKVKFKDLFQFMKDRRVLVILILSSLISIAYLVIGFFYVLKLKEANLNTNWMSFIILVYSSLQMLSPVIIKKIKKYDDVMVLFFELFIISLVFFMLAFLVGYAVFIPMIILPLLISLPDILISRLSNELIDDFNLDEKRAGFLSMLNQGSNLVEILFLFSASLVSVEQISTLFVVVACIFLISSFFSMYRKKIR